MPQIEQLPVIIFSQLFWLLLVFGINLFGIGRGMLPKIQSTVDAREARIAEDLAQAQAAREAAEATEAEWRERMDAARADAARLAQDAKQQSALDTEKRAKAAAAKIGAKADKAQARLRDAVIAARGEIEAVAAEAAQTMVARLTGLDVKPSDAAQAVKAEMHV